MRSHFEIKTAYASCGVLRYGLPVCSPLRYGDRIPVFTGVFTLALKATLLHDPRRRRIFDVTAIGNPPQAEGRKSKAHELCQCLGGIPLTPGGSVEEVRKGGLTLRTVKHVQRYPANELA